MGEGRRSSPGWKSNDQGQMWGVFAPQQPLYNTPCGVRILQTMKGSAMMDQNNSKQLQESEERFRKVFEEGPLGVVLLGLDARIQHCNRRFCEMLGYSEEEIIALGLVGISHPEDWRRRSPVGFTASSWRDSQLHHRQAVCPQRRHGVLGATDRFDDARCRGQANYRHWHG